MRSSFPVIQLLCSSTIPEIVIAMYVVKLAQRKRQKSFCVGVPLEKLSYGLLASVQTKERVLWKNVSDPWIC